MYYSLVHFPNIDKNQINNFRKKYDPYINLIDAHITIIFPVPGSVTKDQLINHINKILQNWKSFDIHIKDTEKAWDHWMFLLLEKGNTEINKLHDELYSGMLKPFLRKDIKYIPHIAIGLFIKEVAVYDLKDPQKTNFDKNTYEDALKEVKQLNFDYNSTVNKLSIVEINDDFTKSILIKEFQLN